MIRILMALVLLLAPAGAHAQQTQEQQRRAAYEARRDSLEAEVVQKFVRRLAHDLKLSSSQRAQTERVLRESGVRRRELSHAGAQLRGRIYRAARNSSTPDAEFTRLLAEHEALRAREHTLWTQDQEQLARFLTPRQRAQFVVAWAHFQEDMRDILSRRMRQQSNSRDRQEDTRGTPPESAVERRDTGEQRETAGDRGRAEPLGVSVEADSGRHGPQRSLGTRNHPPVETARDRCA